MPAIDVNKRCFIVMTFGNWGRGKSLPEAAQKCIESGARKTACCYVNLIVGDDTAQVNSNGFICRDAPSENILIGAFAKVSQLLRKGN